MKNTGREPQKNAAQRGAKREASTAPRDGSRREALLAVLGRKVRSLRTQKGLSQQALALKASISPRFVAQLESGQGNISVAKLAEIARALGSSLPILLSQGGGNEEPGNEATHLRAEIVSRLKGLSVEGLKELSSTLLGLETHGGTNYQEVICLVGLRGAGKSTIGPLLAQALERPFLELDEQVQETTGLATAEIFELHGEAYYREAERSALERLLEKKEPLVVTVSGGAVTDPGIFRLLRQHTMLIWIKADPEHHMSRVISQGDRRPMADRPNAMAELRHLLDERTPYYQQARFIADTSSTSPPACVGALVAMIESAFPPRQDHGG